MLIKKTLALADCEIKLDGASGVFAGYASVFGSVDSYGDTILPGAYKRTLKQNGMPKMFLQHDAYGLPIGKWTDAREDDKGLFVEGELTLGMSRADDTYAALKHGTIDGLSVGYYLRANDYVAREDGGRDIKHISKLVEVSVVTFPADGAARIDLASVKSAIEEVDSIREFERLLRDAGGFDTASAKTLLAKARELFAQRDAGDETGAGNTADELAALAIHPLIRRYRNQETAP